MSIGHYVTNTFNIFQHMYIYMCSFYWSFYNVSWHMAFTLWRPTWCLKYPGPACIYAICILKTFYFFSRAKTTFVKVFHFMICTTKMFFFFPKLHELLSNCNRLLKWFLLCFSPIRRQLEDRENVITCKMTSYSCDTLVFYIPVTLHIYIQHLNLTLGFRCDQF